MAEPRYVVSGHRVPRELIEQVLAGPVDVPTMTALRGGKHSGRLLLLKVLRELVGSTTVGSPEQRTFEEAWRVLVATEKHAPGVVRHVLSYPSVGTWLVRLIRKIRGIVEDDVPIWVDMRYLGSIAASAAIRAGIDARVTVPVWQGRITLPAIGQFEVASEDATCPVSLWAKDSITSVELNDGEWTSLDEVPSFSFRTHRSTADGQVMHWTIDDIDPYRAFVGMTTPNRLRPTEFEDWCRTLDDAWSIVVREHADYVPEVLAADPVIIPASGAGGFVASSSASAFGAVRAALPDSPVAMAETVLHEIQHSKLNALLDLVPLQRPGTDRACYAPWRRDPRSLSGLLHGLYAFTGVTEYWYRRWRSEPRDRTAAFQFLHRREQVREAIRALGPTPELTETGARLLEAVSSRLAACDEGAVPEDLRYLVGLLSAENRLAWRLRHLTPPPAAVTRLVELWFAGERFPAAAVEPVLAPFHRPDTRSTLSLLLTALALDHRPEPGTRAGEGELADRDFATARARFVRRIRADPEDDGAWVGLLLAMGAHGGDESPFPETVSATYRWLAAVSDGPPDPATLIDWFADR